MNASHRTRTLLAAARACALLPMIGGTSIFLLWLLTQSMMFAVAGVLTIYAGVALAALSLVLVVVAWIRARGTREEWRRHVRRSLTITVALVAVNFPLAAGFVFGAAWISSISRVTVINRSDLPLREVRITGGGRDLDLGSIAPGSSTSTSFFFEEDGQLVLHAKQGDRTREEIVIGYVWRDCGESARVTFSDDGKCRIENWGRSRD